MEKLGFKEIQTNLSMYKIGGTRTFVKGNITVVLYNNEILDKHFPKVKNNVVINDSIYLKIYLEKDLINLLKLLK